MKKTFDILCVRNGLARKEAAVKAGFSATNHTQQIKHENFNFKKLKGMAKVFNMTLSEFIATYEKEECNENDE